MRKTNEIVKISGLVSDFKGNRIKDADIWVQNQKFKTLYKTKSDEFGRFNILVKKGLYNSIVIFKDYKVKYLEYWAWNVPVFKNMELEARIDGIELYAMNVFFPQGAYPSIFIYFRPMSLKMAKSLIEKNRFNKEGLLNISPELKIKDIQVKINKEKVKVLRLNKVIEYCGRQSLFAYLIQVSLPEYFNDDDFNKIEVIIKQSKNREYGEGCIFYRKLETL